MGTERKVLTFLNRVPTIEIGYPLCKIGYSLIKKGTKPIFLNRVPTFWNRNHRLNLSYPLLSSNNHAHGKPCVTGLPWRPGKEPKAAPLLESLQGATSGSMYDCSLPQWSHSPGLLKQAYSRDWNVWFCLFYKVGKLFQKVGTLFHNHYPVLKQWIWALITPHTSRNTVASSRANLVRAGSYLCANSART